MECEEDAGEPPLVGAGDLPVATVPISSLVIAGSPRRSGENPEHARMLAELADGLPPIIVHRPTMRVIDGMHRLRAALLRGAQQIEVRYFDGDEASAFALAVRMNVVHGLPLSLGDRRAAADRIIASHPRWSDRAIASVAGLSAPTIAARRRRLTDKNSQSDTRIGKDGRIRPVDPAQRREAAARLLAGNPGVSLRAVSRQTGLSPETVRKVRAQLNHAHQPAAGAPAAEAAAVGSAAVGSAAVGLAGDPPVNGRPSHGQLPAQRPWLQVGERGRPGYTAVRAMLADPAFRSTDSGRTLLRLLAASRALQEGGSEFLQNVPAYSLGRLAEAARECAREWQAFAAEAEQRCARQESVVPRSAAVSRRSS
jgi:ParB-like chromosome segregation protein Spo0J